MVTDEISIRWYSRDDYDSVAALVRELASIFNDPFDERWFRLYMEKRLMDPIPGVYVAVNAAGDVVCVHGGQPGSAPDCDTAGCFHSRRRTIDPRTATLEAWPKGHDRWPDRRASTSADGEGFLFSSSGRSRRHGECDRSTGRVCPMPPGDSQRVCDRRRSRAEGSRSHQCAGGCDKRNMR